MDRAYSFKFQVHHAFCLLTCLLAYSLGSVEFSPAQLMSQNNYTFRWLWTWLSFTWDPTDHITCHDAFRRYIRCRVDHILSIEYTYTVHIRRINLSMRFNGIYASCWKRKEELIKEMFSVWKTTKISKNFVQSKYYEVENACIEVDQFCYLSSIFEVDSKYSEICTE